MTSALPVGDAATAGDVLVVFDFDESLVEVNTVVDTAQALFPEVQERLAAAWNSGQVTWPGLVNLFHELLATEKPEISIAQVREAAARVPVHPQMLEAVRSAVKEHGATVKIVSDSTTFYINAMVEHHKLSDCITQVVANSMSEHPDFPNRLQMLPFHGPPDAPHGCPHCPANMCKGACALPVASCANILADCIELYLSRFGRLQGGSLTSCGATARTRGFCTSATDLATTVQPCGSLRTHKLPPPCSAHVRTVLTRTSRETVVV